VDASLLRKDDSKHLRIGGIDIDDQHQKEDGILVTLLPCLPRLDIKPVSEVMQFVMDACAEHHGNECDACPDAGRMSQTV
jgi:hypothetical protein